MKLIWLQDTSKMNGKAFAEWERKMLTLEVFTALFTIACFATGSVLTVIGIA